MPCPPAPAEPHSEKEGLTPGLKGSFQLNLAEGTVKNHASAVLGKLGIADRMKAVLFAIAYTQAPLYFLNQNQYLLHGTAQTPGSHLAADWLARHHPGSGWQFVLLDGRHSAESNRLRQDAAQANLTTVNVLDHRDDRWLAAADAICDLGGSSVGLRPVLDAAATAVPIIATSNPQLVGTALAHGEISFVSPNNPLALAHALLDLAKNPAARDRRLIAAHRGVLAAHHPIELLTRYAQVLESLCARRT